MAKNENKQENEKTEIPEPAITRKPVDTRNEETKKVFEAQQKALSERREQQLKQNLTARGQSDTKAEQIAKETAKVKKAQETGKFKRSTGLARRSISGERVKAVAKVLELLATEEFVTRADIEKATNYNPKTVAALLSDMRKSRLIRRVTATNSKNVRVFRYRTGGHRIFKG